MKTVKEILSETSSGVIAKALFQKHLHTLIEQAEPNETIAEIRNRVLKWTSDVVSYIVNAPSDKKMEPFVFFAIPSAIDYSYYLNYGFIETVMCDAKELLQDDKESISYGWSDQPYVALANSYLAETILTANNLFEVLSDILWEATWFGKNEDERMETWGEIFNEEDSEFMTSEEFDSYMKEEFSKDSRMEFDDVEEDFVSKRSKAENDYYAYCFRRETEKVKKMVKEAFTKE